MHKTSASELVRNKEKNSVFVYEKENNYFEIKNSLSSHYFNKCHL